jgi:hypothetical protein
MNTKTISVQDLVNKLRHYKAESDRLKLRYQELQEALNREQEAHAQTKRNLLKILGDTIAARSA